MTIRSRLLLSIPVGAAEKWTNAPCDCGGYDGKEHSNDYRLFGEFLCMTAPDDDGVIYKWQVMFLEDGSQFARGFGHTLEECQSQAEMTAKALVTDRAAYLANNPDQQQPTQ